MPNVQKMSSTIEAQKVLLLGRIEVSSVETCYHAERLLNLAGADCVTVVRIEQATAQICRVRHAIGRKQSGVRAVESECKVVH